MREVADCKFTRESTRTSLAKKGSTAGARAAGLKPLAWNPPGPPVSCKTALTPLAVAARHLSGIFTKAGAPVPVPDSKSLKSLVSRPKALKGMEFA
jgi:hypothetical protein